MFDAKSIAEFLSSPDYLTEQEIVDLMDEEMDKGEDMDTDFVDLLAQTLLRIEEEREAKQTEVVAEQNNEIIELPTKKDPEEEDEDDGKEKPQNPNIITYRGRARLKKALLAAALSAVMLTATASASAHFFNFNIAEELFEYFGTYLKLKQEGGTQNANSYSLTGSALAKELEANGISPVTLPAALLNDEWEIENISYQKDEFFSSSDIRLENGNAVAIINIVQYTSEDFLTDIKVSYPSKGTQMEINGMDVFAFQLKETANAIYRDRLTDYSISVDCDYDSFVEIIKTIK